MEENLNTSVKKYGKNWHIKVYVCVCIFDILVFEHDALLLNKFRFI